MAEGMGRERMRASDADREQVVERLRAALDEGRLDLGEYDERMQRAYAAKTYGDLDGLLTDLPVGRSAMPAVPEEKTPRHPTAEWILHQWQSWVPAAMVFTAIWAISGFGEYWPGWIIGIWGVALLWRTINGLMTGAPRRELEERRARELKEREKKERRALDAERRAQSAGASSQPEPLPPRPPEPVLRPEPPRPSETSPRSEPSRPLETPRLETPRLETPRPETKPETKKKNTDMSGSSGGDTPDHG